MGILRSERMQHGTLVIPVERAGEIIALLGMRGSLQIQDMNQVSMRRPYRRYVQRIEELERMLRYLTEEISKLPGAQVESKHYDDFLSNDSYVLDNVEESLQTLHAQFVKFRENNDDLLKQRNRAMMEHAVSNAAMKSLKNTQVPSTFTRDSQASQALLRSDYENAQVAVTGFSSFAGVVLQSDQEKLSRTIFRATRGNAFTHIEDLDEMFPETTAMQKRSVFVVYYQGGPGSAMHEKITRICQAFGIEVFDWPKSAQAAEGKMKVLQEVIDDKSKALEAFEEFFFDEVSVLLDPVRHDGNSLIEEWRMFCQKQKAIFGCLNLFEETDTTLRAECWYPSQDEETMRMLLSSFCGPTQVSAFLLSDREERKRRNPPTYIKTTKFSECFQNIVDTYGVPRYQEANPALLTIVTFPFLFGVMYGDIGHGGLVLLFGSYLIISYEKLVKIDGELLQMILYGRYLIFMMGAFAVYSGFIYNDFFSLGLDIFGSRYKESSKDESVFIPNRSSQTFPYPFGFDPVWKGARNELDFMNSFKMKFSVIVAAVQMTAGVLLKAFNSIHFKDHLTLYFEFIPQLIFMLGLVGYMDFLIFYKWASEYHNQPRASIISTLIGMFMMREVTPEDQFFSGQQNVQLVLFSLMMISVPLMLLPKPLILLARNKRAVNKRDPYNAVGDEEEIVPLSSTGGVVNNQHTANQHTANQHTANQQTANQQTESMIKISGKNIPTAVVEDQEEEEFEFSEIMIHQMIETIEFVLGVVSNTASYLRLWALSLAHQQLALVFFENIIILALNATVTPNGNAIVPGIALFLAFAMFAAVTFGIMMCMDTLECFLHALRLQWVEFQNKFYHADGHKFIPFSFFRILSGVDVD